MESGSIPHFYRQIEAANGNGKTCVDIRCPTLKPANPSFISYIGH